MATQNKSRRFLPREVKKEITYDKINKKELLHIKKYFEEFFGLEHSVLDRYEFLKRRDDLWVTTKKNLTSQNLRADKLRINTIGIRAVRNSFSTNPKITTNFAQIIGSEFQKNAYDMSESEMVEFVHGHDLYTKGNYFSYCVLRYKGRVYGVGQYKDGRIKNQVPKSRVIKTSF